MNSPRLVFQALACLVLVLCLPSACRAAIQCSDVVKDLSPCVKYLTSGSGMPSATCCAGASKLANAVTTSDDRRAACSCIKTAATRMQPNVAAAKALAGNCGISLPFAVSANVDCSKIS